MHLQVLRQQIPQGPCSYELGYAEQFKFNGNVSNNGLDLEKVNVKLCIIADVLMIISKFFSINDVNYLLLQGHSPDIQRNLTEEVSPRNNVGSSWQDSNTSKSAFFDIPSGFHGANVTAQTR